MRSITRAALGAAGAVLLVCGMSAGTAQASVGAVLVTQHGSNGQTVCTQEYVLVPLIVQSVHAPICTGAINADIANLSTQAIKVGGTGVSDLRIEIQGGAVVELDGLSDLNISIDS